MTDRADRPGTRRYRRRFRAALAIYLAVLTYRRLSVDDRLRIAAWIRDYLDSSSNAVTNYLEFEAFFQTSSKAAFWAVAMKSLGIPPALEGESWPIPSQRHWWHRLWAIDRLLLAYHPFTDVTDDVETYLVSKGVDASALGMRSDRPETDRRQQPRDSIQHEVSERQEKRG